ncbi:MAG TPA: tetratricopeptide repeat protein, partial [Chthonomonadaceae bacterium]|nr:tetratricopeptide repeat protein [Chthonomonadaceae bacterium]
YYSRGLDAQAEPLLVRALAIREKVLGEVHPDTAQSLNNLAGLYEAQSRYAQAKSLYVRALAIYDKTLGPNHQRTQTTRGNLSRVRRLMNQRKAKSQDLKTVKR